LGIRIWARTSWSTCATRKPACAGGSGSGGGRRFAGIGEPVVGDDAKQEKAREKNAKAHIIVRCYVDDFAEILETLGANEVIASSKSAFDGIALRLAAK